MPTPSWMQNTPPNTKNQRLMRVADQMYDFCREIESGVINQNMIARKAKYLADKYDDEMSIDDQVPGQLGENVVEIVANILTEDPDIIK